jgi:NADH-quinone oxidoreductase subunit A
MLLDYLPVLLMFGFVAFAATMILFVSSLIRPSNPYPEKNQPYECGIDPIGEADAGRFKLHYFIIAILFIVFDVETLYLFPWAVVLNKIGFFAYIEMFIFIFLLLIGLIYAWVKGALDWVQ